MPEFESWVKAAQAFFSEDPHGRKIEISEFKQLTDDDKRELSDELNKIGYNHPSKF